MIDRKSHPQAIAEAYDRRRALLLVVGAGVTMPALILPGCSAGSSEKTGGGGHEANEEGGDGEVTANEDLMREHGVLRRILILYREVAPKLIANPAGVDAAAITTAAALFRDFGERYHEQMLEERHIFPLVRKAGGDGAALIDTLLIQHERGRAVTAYVLDRTKAGRISSADGEALASAMTGFARMYEAHAAREDTIVFPAFKKSIGEDTYHELGEQFEEIEHKQFGGDGFDFALDKLADAERILGVQDLTNFTASMPPAG